MKDYLRYWNKCDTCGRFIAYREMEQGGGASWKFVPDSHVSYEESAWRCKACTEKDGAPIPRQNVRLDMCQGVK
jgi:hypothetical protein